MLRFAVEKFESIGDVLYPEQRSIYNSLGKRLSGKYVIDIGCGIGIGTNILGIHAKVVGVDVVSANVRAASKLYSHLNFFEWDIKKGACEPKVDVAVAIEVIEHIEQPELAIRNMIDSAKEAVFLSSPNRKNQNLGQDKPLNDYHVKEYTPEEVVEMIGMDVRIYDLLSFKELDKDTTHTPLLYEVILEQA